MVQEFPKFVSERLGQVNVSISLDKYSHVTPNLQSKSAENF